MAGIFPDEATIYIVDSSTATSSLASTDAVQGEITRIGESGGERETESRPVFGGGNVTKKNPRNQIKVEIDVIPQYGANSVRWDEMIMGSTLKSNAEGDDKAIYIQYTDGSNYYTRSYRNAKGVSFDPDTAADDMFTGTITFNLDPTDSTSAANKQVTTTAASTVSWS